MEHEYKIFRENEELQKLIKIEAAKYVSCK